MTIRRTLRLTRHLAATGLSAAASAGSAALETRLPVPATDSVPEGRMVELPGRGRTFVVDAPGPTPDAPVVVLLHGLACTAYLCWFQVFERLGATHRVVALDQRWHGRGIRSEQFRIADCADDVVAVLDALGVEQAVVAGYSLGGFVAQETWRRHPDRVAGLVLCSTARNGRGRWGEQFFFPVLGAVARPLSGLAVSRVERVASALPADPDVRLEDLRAWGSAEFRSTSPWAFPAVISEVGGFNSAGWIGDVDVPTAVVVTVRDRAIPTRRQRRLAESIPDAVVHEAPGGHASVFLDADRWVPVFVAAVVDVTRRAPTPR